MNWQQIKKNVGWHVRLIPPAYFLDSAGRPTPSTDNDWQVDCVTESGLSISNTRTHHVATLGKDHIYRFTSDPQRSRAGVQHAFLTLTVQLFVQGSDIWVAPNVRPGEPVDPPAAKVRGAFGNIRERAMALSQEVMQDLCRHGWKHGRIPCPGWEGSVRPMPHDKEGVIQWGRARAHHFRARSFRKVVAMRDEFAQLHLGDIRLDEYLEIIASVVEADRRVGPSRPAMEFIPLPMEIEEIAKRLEALAASVS